MNSRVANYLMLPPREFPAWTDDGEAVVWPDGTTIAVRAEVRAVLARLVPYGLPPFGAVVLLLAACRRTWRPSRALAVLTAPEPPNPVADGRELLVAYPLSEVLARLEEVNRLPPALLAQPAAVTTLAEMVFAKWCAPFPAAEAPAVVEALLEAPPEGVRKPGLAHAFALSRRPLTLALWEGLRQLDLAALEPRLRTGLDRAPAPAPLALPDLAQVRQLLEALATDRDLAGLARLARHLMAVVQMPRPLSAPDEMPVGGLSDLSNRGPLDRLLLSELAQDDLVLAARLALHEALYLRRESPPRAPGRQRLLLIDTGIRMWGLPRVFAAAAALAVAAAPGPPVRLGAFLPDGTLVQPVSLTTRAGLEQLLGALTRAPHPGAAFAAFAAQATGPDDELIVITHEHALNDREFRAALGGPGAALGGPGSARPPDCPAFCAATVTGHGAFRWWAVNRHGQRLVHAADLDLRQILGTVDGDLAPVSLAAPAVSEGPLFARCQPLPLLLPAPEAVPTARLGAPGEGVLLVTADRGLAYWATPELGLLELQAELPPGRVLWLGLCEAWALVLLAAHDEPCLLAVHTTTLECRRYPLTTAPGQELRGAFAIQDLLFLVFPRQLLAYHLKTGEPATNLPVPKQATWTHGRFFAVGKKWTCVASRWFRSAFEQVPLPHVSRAGPFAGLFDRAGHDGPWAVTGDGTICSLADSPPQALKTPLVEATGLLAVCGEGRFVAVGGKNELGMEAWYLADLDREQYYAGNTEPCSWDWIAARLAGYEPTRGLVGADVQGALITDDGRLGLWGPRQGCARLEVDDRDHLVMRFIAQSKPPGADYRAFALAPEAPYCCRRVAVWPHGLRAWLDPRGLLHLKRTAGTPTDLTLVLAPDGVAGWLADGTRCGPTFFTGGRQTVSGRVFARRLQEFIGR